MKHESVNYMWKQWHERKLKGVVLTPVSTLKEIATDLEVTYQSLKALLESKPGAPKPKFLGSQRNRPCSFYNKAEVVAWFANYNK